MRLWRWFQIQNHYWTIPIRWLVASLANLTNTALIWYGCVAINPTCAESVPCHVLDPWRAGPSPVCRHQLRCRLGAACTPGGTPRRPGLRLNDRNRKEKNGYLTYSINAQEELNRVIQSLLTKERITFQKPFRIIILTLSWFVSQILSFVNA